MSLRECAIQCMTPHEHEIRLALHTHIEAKRGKAYKRDWVVGGSVRLRLFLWDRRKFPSVDVFRIFFFVAPFNSLHHRLRYVFIWLCVWPEKLTKAKKGEYRKQQKLIAVFFLCSAVLFWISLVWPFGYRSVSVSNLCIIKMMATWGRERKSQNRLYTASKQKHIRYSVDTKRVPKKNGALEE